MSKSQINKEIFDIGIVTKAIEDYSDIASINVSETKDYIELEFDNCKYDTEETVKEFENYLIDLTNS